MHTDLGRHRAKTRLLTLRLVLVHFLRFHRMNSFNTIPPGVVFYIQKNPYNPVPPITIFLVSLRECLVSVDRPPQKLVLFKRRLKKKVWSLISMDN